MIEKLASGVLRVLTPLGPRYIRPTFLQRVYLMWLFRNFPILSPQVLSRRQKRTIERWCNRHGFVSLTIHNGSDAPILGTLERRPAVNVEEAERAAKIPVSAVRPMDGLRQRS